MQKIVVTGGAGFIGSNFIKRILNTTTDVEIINLDSLTYAGNLNNLVDVKDDDRYSFVKGDVTNKEFLEFILGLEKIDGIINFAAESHVDRSINDATPFIETNITGTLNLLECVKKFNIEKYLQVSTDEVYGSLGPTGLFTEDTPIDPKSPYSASKASADHLVLAFVNTFGINANITRCSNNYGPYQFPEKLIPLMLNNAMEDKELPVYGDGLNVRDWIYVDDHCDGIWSVFQKGKTGEVYNIGGNSEKTNISIVKLLLEKLNKPESLIKYVKDRPGHDKRYAIDNTKISTELGWKPKWTFEQGIESTIKWYQDNKQWSDEVRSGEYQNFYHKWYVAR